LSSSAGMAIPVSPKHHCLHIVPPHPPDLNLKFFLRFSLL
jgi:hypothetical protein